MNIRARVSVLTVRRRILMKLFEVRWLKKIALVRRLIPRMLVYSAIKIRANSPALNSILNPDTSSDSPSARSNGVRLVSARFVINHRVVTGRIISSSGVIWLELMNVRSNEYSIIILQIRMSDILTSYEMVCATLRRAPSRAYFELEHHPPKKVV